jgi:uracil phosphoribosyltransferase
MTRPPERRIVTNFSAEGKSHQTQLQAMADDLLKHMRANLNDPRQFKTYAESFAIVSKLLSDELPTEKKKAETPVDISAFEE